jgi:hypothetical protein
MCTPAVDPIGTARCTDITQRRFTALFAAGLLIRLIALPLHGTEDVLVWKTWSYGALHQGVSRLYGVGGHPPERGLVRWGERVTTVDYPPLALYALTATGFVYQAVSPGFENTRWLNIAIKTPGLLAEIALTWLLWTFVSRRYGEDKGRWAATAFWANPATILSGPVLGYLDPLAAVPAVGSLIAASLGAPIVAGALLALACLTKLQAVLMIPIVLLAMWNAGSAERLSRFSSGVVAACAVTFIMLLPYFLIGAGRNVVQGVSSLLRHDMLSAYAANVWWIVTYVMRAIYAVGDMGIWDAWTMRLRILGVSTLVGLGYPNPRPLATSAVLIATGWTLWRVRHSRDVSLVAASAAFIVHAYFVLGIAVHENHLYFALPLLALAAAARPQLRPIHMAVSAVVTLNLFLFFGLGQGVPLPPRNFTIIDSTAVLAVANCALVVWHLRVFRRESIAD